MANQIILKRSSTPGKVPTTSQLALGEIAINTHDGLIYIKKDDGTPSIAQIGGVTSVNSETGAVVLTTDDVAQGSTNKYFSNAQARAAVSAGTGISYNSSTGVITTTQNLSTAGTPTFAGLTLTGSVGITGSIVPSADVTYDLGSLTKQWKDIYVGPGSLFVNGQKVLQDDSGTITFSADIDENIRIKTLGTGILQLGSTSTLIQLDSTLQITSGKNITDSAGVQVNFGDNIQMNNNKVVGLGTPSSATDAATKGYVDSAVGALSTSSISQGNSSVQVIDSGTGTVTVTVDGNTALTVDATGVIVAGNFTVSGTTTTVNSNQIALADNTLTLNSDATGTPTQNAGLEVERGDEANVQLRWNEGSDKWTFTNDGAVYYPVSTGTDDLAEGSTNLYFTNGRARTALSASSSTGISYNSSTGLFSLGSIPNSSLSNNSISINGISVALGGSRTLGTDEVAEGATNKYYTDGRVRDAVSAGGSLSYNSTTGVFSYTTPTTIASLSNHSTSNLAEGTNLYYTDARAVSANTTAIATAKSEAISAAATDATSKVAAEATARAAAISAAVAAKDNTDEITEGTSNLYFTNARARGAVSFTAGSGAYNSTTGVFSIPTNTNQLTNGAGFATTGYVDNAVAGKDNTDEITEGTSNLYFTTARARSSVSAGGSLSYNSTTGVISFTTPSTSGISEGTNLYYTDARARAAVSAGTGISYNSTTGVITNTITQYTDALARGAVSFTAGSGAYNSTTGVFSIPTNTNQLTNGAGFVTSSGVTSVATGNGLTGGTITSTGTLALSGSYSGTWAVSGAITATGEVTAFFSDKRLKTNIVPIAEALDKVESISGYTFDPNETALALGVENRHQMGVIAQEIELVAPELVCDSAFEGYKTVRYDKLTALLIEAVKELSAKVKTLEAKLGNTKPTL